MTPPTPHSHEPRTVRFNFVCHCLEGGLYMGGMAFLSPDAVLPKMVDTLGGRVAVVAMMPILLAAAFSISQLFSAPVVERLPKLKPWVLTFGFLQRLPYLVTGLLLLFGQSLGDKLLTIVVLTPVVSGLIGGIGVVAWMEMVTRMIPERQRASGWAVRYVMQAVIGITAGPAIHWILTHRTGADGYATLHLIAFGFLALSFVAQIPMREHLLDHRPVTPPQPYFAYLAGLPRLLLSTPHLGKLVATRFTGMGYLMLLGFLTKHALGITNRPEADEGFFVTFGQIGTILGSLLAGWWGNRNGGKVLLITSRIICIVVCCWASMVQSYPAFLVAFFIVGFGLFVDRVGDLTLAAELCPVERRSTLQAILGFATGLSLLLAGWIGGQIYTHTLSIGAVATTGAVMAVISIVILRRIPEPRHPRRIRVTHDVHQRFLTTSRFITPMQIIPKPIGNFTSQWGEGPIWSGNRLLYVDIEAHKIISFNPNTGVEKIWDVGQRVGTVVPRASGGLVWAGDHGIYKMDEHSGMSTLICDPEKGIETNRFNDGKCDPAGRFWAGTMHLGPQRTATGSLWCLHPDQRIEKKFGPVTVSNGIVWTRDKRTMYYIDTPRKTVLAFDFDNATGGISQERIAINCASYAGVPDGMTIDADDRLWIAFCHGGKVLCIDPKTAAIEHEISFPCIETTACAFGGPDLGDLFITTGISKAHDEPLAGRVFVCQPGAHGVPSDAFRG